MTSPFDIIIVGAGPIGMSTALACAYYGQSVALIDARRPDNPTVDGRASTIAASSVHMLRNLDVWNDLSVHMQPITDMMIGEGAPGDISPLTLHFDGKSQRADAMAYIGENAHLSAALYAAVKKQTNITPFFDRKLVRADTDASLHLASAELDDGTTLKAHILVAADGKNSRLRKMAGIGAPKTDYTQSAIVTTVAHEEDHGGVAYQMFYAGGPFAILPLPGKRSSLVWTDKTPAIKAAMALGEAHFMSELSRRFGNLFGALTLDAPRQSFPLTLQMAECYAKGRLALVGDAAHAIHPLAGQGLNMGLRDACALAQSIAVQKSAGLDPLGALSEYGQWRNFDNTALAGMTDMLNRLFSNKILPLRHARRLGLAAVDNATSAKRFFMSEAAGEAGDLPELLQVS
ncbi:MAG: UbiH/UbiF/VisC/COQ6 family ubiquinone biosynthesis hydroxylase [Maricaulaceae bacterium]